MAAARAAADEVGPAALPLPRRPGARVLPVPLMNIINGGAHADNTLDIQEFMIVPRGCRTSRDALRAGAEVFHTLKKLLHERKASTGVGDEGGFAPDLPGDEEALGVILEAIEKAGYEPGKEIALALDVAASELFDKTSKTYKFEGEGKELDGKGMVEFYRSSCEKYPIVSIEDGLAEDDWDGWEALTAGAGQARAARRRRPVRHQHRAPQGRHREERREQRPRQGQPDRHADRDARGDRDGPPRRLDVDHLAPLGRDRGHVHRRPRRRDERRPDQDRLAGAHRPRREVQPAPAHRGGARRLRHLGRHRSAACSLPVPSGPVPSPRLRGEVQ